MSLRFSQELMLSQAVIAVMEWCKQNGYACYVSFGGDRVAEVYIRKRCKE